MTFKTIEQGGIPEEVLAETENEEVEQTDESGDTIADLDLVTGRNDLDKPLHPNLDGTPAKLRSSTRR